MDTEHTTKVSTRGLTRREALKRGELATAAIWAAPAITTYGSRAVAQSAAAACGAEFSFSGSGQNCTASGPSAFNGGAWPGMPTVSCFSTDVSATCSNTGSNVVGVSTDATCNITHAVAELDGGAGYINGTISANGINAVFVADTGSNQRILRVRVIVAC